MASSVIYFVRHGEMPLNREENYDKLIKTGINGPLSERGIAEAEALGKHLNNTKFHRAYASDLVRTQETAKNILKHSTHPTPEILIEKRISEREPGEWAEKTPMDMIKEAMKAQTYPHFLPCVGGESVEEVMKRASDFFEELCDELEKGSDEENVIVACHGAWLAIFFEHLISLKDKSYELIDCNIELVRKPAPTTGVTKISISKEKVQSGDSVKRAIKFLATHDQTHLKDQELPK